MNIDLASKMGKAVFINNKKIILNDEQYNKLKSLT